MEPGQQIDIWVVEKKLGAGGMGSVYRCHNAHASRIKAAIKVLEITGSRAPGATARFVREAEILFALEHPNIVKVRNVRTDITPPYLEMEFVEGQSLEGMLGRGAIPFTTALDYMNQLANAIAYLHTVGIRHRDLKPANMLVRSDGRLKVVDFGLAMEAGGSRLTQDGMTFGTVSYAPPEWVTPDALDPTAWDLYALGVVFWEMLTGKVAFPVSGTGSARQQAMQVILSKQNHPPLDPGDEFHDDLRGLIAELTDRDPEKRPKTAIEVAKRVHTLTAKLAKEAGATLAPVTEELTALNKEALASAEAIRQQLDNERPTVNTFHFDASSTENTPAPVKRKMHQSVEEVATRSTPNAPNVAKAAAAVSVVALSGLILLIGALIWVVLNVSNAPLEVPHRPVEIAVAGLSPDTVFSLDIDGHSPKKSEGWLSQFSTVETGERTLHWTLGERCSVKRCPGKNCPKWCAHGSKRINVTEGAGTQVVSLSLQTPPTRKVRLVSPQLDIGSPVTFAIEGEEGTSLSHNMWNFSLVPQKYSLLAQAGVCEAGIKNCQDDKSCAPGCSSWSGYIVVPWGTDDLVLDVPLDTPKAASAHKKGHIKSAVTDTPNEDSKLKRPVQKPKKASNTWASAKRRVTQGDFANWLMSHPDWQRDAAITANRADGKYLAKWDGLTPPTASADMVNVSWYAASAYCRSKGGLAETKAPPESWGAGPFLEWRIEGGKPAWRSKSGTSSTKAKMKESNTMTGFRCQR